MKVLFLVNARSGARRGIDFRSIIESACDWAEFRVVPTERKEELDAIIGDAEDDGHAAVFAVGGDGTVHEIGKRLIGRRTALGIVPVGSGNGLARHLRIPCDARAAVTACRTAHAVPIDTAEVNGLPYLGVMGIGFDARIAHDFATRPGRGFRTYLEVGLSAILNYRPDEYEIEADGEIIRTRAFAVAVANGSQYGNNAYVAANASVRDAFLDLVVFRQVPLLFAPIVTYRVFAGTAHKSRAVIARKAKNIVIRRLGPGIAHLDGEPVTLGEELRVTVRPKSLNVMVTCDEGVL